MQRVCGSDALSQVSRTLELLFAGDVDEVERRARGLLFDSSVRTTPMWQLAVLEQDDELEPAPAPPSPTYEDSDFA